MTDIVRELGQLQISIGTSLAIEGFLGIHPSQPRLPSIRREVTELWINLATLIRNFYASMTVEQQEQVELNDVVFIITDEMRIIESTVRSHTTGKVDVVYYHSNIDRLNKQFPKAVIKTPSTLRQMALDESMKSTMKGLIQTLRYENIPFIEIEDRPSVSMNVVTILTHYPHELLWDTRFNSLILLESHTGRLKQKSLWNGKLSGVSIEDRIPFNEVTLCIFGDNVLFKGGPIKDRKLIRELGEKNRWNIVTTVSKMKHDVNTKLDSNDRTRILDSYF